ncbi:hypothetical protein OUZ56_009507 [Daphnia magna]|uniref:Uncharacterized protein n=1 Tax=Daphnia magna TaxID=35525 RepID=A0ABR0AG60_9CRUS|nr:hypothetical protein OUZ56_009507 [Daphnia magna]
MLSMGGEGQKQTFLGSLFACFDVILSRVKRDIGYLFAEMSHPLLGQSCDRGEEIIGRSPLQERYADMQSGRGVIRATV